MQTRRGNWRGKLVEHVATIARVAYPGSAAAITVQRLLDDPTERVSAINVALKRCNPATNSVGTSDEYQRVQAAADALAGYEGAVI